MKPGPSSRNTPKPSFDLREILLNESVLAYFQPIVSIDRRTIAGVEGLSRGLLPGTQQIIPPVDLFHQAAIEGYSLELDRLCRKKVLEGFSRARAENPDLFLTLNLDSANFDPGVVGSGYLKTQVMELGLEPRHVALEVIESAVRDLDELRRFVDTYRGLGFLIALDDVGAGHSNLNRIPLIKPDILKVDRYLVQGIQDDSYKQEVLRSLVNMARRLGTLIIAEGVEEESEALCLLDMDVDMIQGYYFSKPFPFEKIERETIHGQVEGLVKSFKEKRLKNVGIRRSRISRYYAALMEIQIELAKKDEEALDEGLKAVAAKFPGVDSFYVLDEGGLQASECLTQALGRSHRNAIVFRPPPKGTDHSMKDYYYFLTEPGQNKTSFVTDPYLSMVTGRSCVTLSAPFKGKGGKKYILCLDLSTEALSQESVE
ncbi:MAG TPA: EAL domain-containing protein [bacterium]|nr:EAL domain-containing protein [bacterium]